MGSIKGSFLFVAFLLAVVTSVSSQSRLNGQPGFGPGRGQQRSDMISVCHATGSQENPYETIAVAENGRAHRYHPADIIPEPTDGCPGPIGDDPPTPTPEPLTMLLFGSGIAGIGYAARRFRRRDRQ